MDLGVLLYWFSSGTIALRKFAMFKRAVEYFIPLLSGASEEHRRRIRLLAYAIFITAVFSLFYVVVSMVSGSIICAAINFASCLFFFFLLYLLRSGISGLRIANLFGLMGIIGIAGCIYFDNGLHSPVLPWLATTPIVILLLAGKK